MKQTTRFITPLLGLALACAGAQAASVITGVTASSTSTYPSYPPLAVTNLVNSSGLVNGAGTPVTGDVTALHRANTDVGSGNFWTTANNATTPTLTFTLGGAYDLENIYIWNGNQGYAGQNVTDRGVQQFDVLVSTDGAIFTEVLSNQTLTRSPYYPAGNGTDGYLDRIAAQSFSLTGQNDITHVQIKVDSNFGSTYTGLSEVAFTQIPEPASALLGGLGLLALLRRRRA